MTTIGVWIDSDHLTLMKISRATLSKCLDHSTNLMTGNDVGLGHGIATEESIKVTATETNILKPKENFAFSCYRLREVNNLNLL
jgi:hypothetical protein